MEPRPFTVKICGLRDAQALETAIEAKATTAGFIAAPRSRRYVSPAETKELISLFPEAKIAKAGVFVDPSLDEVRSYVDAGIEIVQLHGSETPEFAFAVSAFATVWRALSPRTREEIDAVAEFPCSAFLIDAYSPSARGGSGVKGDWGLAAYAASKLKRPVILAGGLTPENVGEAIAAVRPSGVDVSSGVENMHGVKCPLLIRSFIEAALQAGAKL